MRWIPRAEALTLAYSLWVQDDLGRDKRTNQEQRPSPSSQVTRVWLSGRDSMSSSSQSTRPQIQSNCGPGTPSIKRGSGSPPRAVSWLPSGLSLWNLRLTNSSFKPVWQIWVWNSGLSVSESETQMDQIQRWQCFPSFRVRSNALCGFPDSSAGKESACNAGDSGSIPGLGRSAGEGIGYPHQYSWASLVAQLVKNPPAMRETPVPFLGWEDPLEKGKATHSSVLAWRIPWTV